MPQQSKRRVELLKILDREELPFRDLAGLRRREMDSVAYLGRAAFEARRYQDSARIFEFLESIEPDNPSHSLNRAHAEARSELRDRAICSINRFLDRARHHETGDVIDALLLRAHLTKDHDPGSALADCKTARDLEQQTETVCGGSRENSAP